MIFEFQTVDLGDYNLCEATNELLNRGWRVLKFIPAPNSMKAVVYSCQGGRHRDHDENEHTQATRDWNSRGCHPLLTP